MSPDNPREPSSQILVWYFRNRRRRVLEVRGLCKWYSGIPVLKGVSFTLEDGQVSGYLGPNGAGKSTTAKILSGLLQPSEGQVLWNGRDISQCLVEFKARLGYVPEEPLLYPFLTGFEYLKLVGQLRGISEKSLKRKIDSILNLLSLHSSRHLALGSYSKGLQQKILLAAALLHNPELLILDEPLSGLDVTSSLIIRNVIQSLAAEGKTILFSSHILELVEKMCSRVMILHRGSLVADGSVENLRGLMNLSSLEEVFSQLIIQEDTQKIALEIVDVVKSE
jgi:ABC-2 type transport system ATP-binding protein